MVKHTVSSTPATEYAACWAFQELSSSYSGARVSRGSKTSQWRTPASRSLCSPAEAKS